MTNEAYPLNKNAGVFFVCLDDARDGVLSGRLYSQYRGTPQRFIGLDALFDLADGWMDRFGKPQADFARRGFQPTGKERTAGSRRLHEPLRQDWPMVLTERGALGTFYFHVFYRQGGSWQGCAEWLWGEEGQRLSFRSALELQRAIRDMVLHQPQAEGTRLTERPSATRIGTK